MLDRPSHTTSARRPNNTETSSHPAGPTWKPAKPGDQPSEKLLEAKFAHDRREMERALDHLQIHDPAQREALRDAMVVKRSYDARKIEDASRKDDPPTNALACGLQQGWTLLKEAEKSQFATKNDLYKPFRDILLAVGAYEAGSLEPLRALRGTAPNKTNAAQPVNAIIHALIALCVERLSAGGMQNGGFKVTEAAKHVADHATARGVQRTKLTVRCIYYDVINRRDEEAAAWYAKLPKGGTRLSREDRLDWLRQLTIFAKLAES